jgi:hypothetical protein
MHSATTILAGNCGRITSNSDVTRLGKSCRQDVQNRRNQHVLKNWSEAVIGSAGVFRNSWAKLSQARRFRFPPLRAVAQVVWGWAR